MHASTFAYRYDDFLPYLPIVAMFVLKLTGVTLVNNPARRAQTKKIQANNQNINLRGLILFYYRCIVMPTKIIFLMQKKKKSCVCFEEMEIRSITSENDTRLDLL